MGLTEVLRQEKKYLLNYIETEQLNYLLDNTLHRDTNCAGQSGYLVRSLYFDTPGDTDFREKSDGIRDRKKVRIRIYHAKAENAKLELKEKQGDFQRKRSLLLTRAEAKEMILGNYICLTNREDEFAWEMYTLMETNLYRPRCIVEYDRRAWTIPENDIRITLDGGIRATEASFDLFAKDIMYYPVSGIGMTVLEVKFNRFLLSYVRDLLEGHRRFQTSASKYSMARSISMRGTE
jgi:hypothetical protein